MRFVAGHSGRVQGGAQVHNWLGDEIGYYSLHKYLRENYPKTGTCEECGNRAGTEYSLIKGRTYSRNREDYRELCPLCHRRYDLGGTELSPEVRARMSAGRKRSWDENRPEGPVPWIKRGEDSLSAKLTTEIVRECRVRYSAGESVASLAREFGVGPKTMHQAVTGKTWAHIR